MSEQGKSYELIQLFGEVVLFTPERINNTVLPKEIHKYELRHDDECQGIICEIAKGVIVNFWGTILSKRPIHLPSGSKEINETFDVQYLNTKNITISEYLEMFHIHKKESRGTSR